MLAVVLTFDRLPCPALGCYGNEWIDTPHFDRLAAEGFVFDAHVARFGMGSSRRDDWGWRTALSSAGVRTMHIREAGAQHDWVGPPTSDCVEVGGRHGADASPRDWPFAHLMRAGSEWLAASVDRSPRQLLWLHSAGNPVPCGVHPDVESLYVDEFADRGVDWSTLTDDERSRHPIVQAGYLSCMDHFLGDFLDVLANVRPVSVLFAISAQHGGRWQTVPRRFELPAETEAQWLRSPSIWWTSKTDNTGREPGWEAGPVKSPGIEGRAILPGRSAAIVQPQDFGPTLLEWFGIPLAPIDDGRSLWPIIDGTAPRVRDAAVIDGSIIWTERDITLVPSPDADIATARRFLWPEDLWQVNDIAAQTPDIVAERVRMREAQG